jgi:hypothetical protein
MRYCLLIAILLFVAESTALYFKGVFKGGLTFKADTIRTHSINPAFEHNLLIIKNKRLLFEEQPFSRINIYEQMVGFTL